MPGQGGKVGAFGRQTPVEKSGLSGGHVHRPVPPGRICTPGHDGNPTGFGRGAQTPVEKSGLSGGQVHCPAPTRICPRGQGGSPGPFCLGEQMPVEKSGLFVGHTQAPAPGRTIPPGQGGNPTGLGGALGAHTPFGPSCLSGGQTQALPILTLPPWQRFSLRSKSTMLMQMPVGSRLKSGRQTDTQLPPKYSCPGPQVLP
jgi:hypothetical protein